MFEGITTKFRDVFSALKSKKLTEENLSDAVRQVRMALLDADVNYTVASKFVKRVKEKALGEEVKKSLTPDQTFIKIVHDELVALMGSEESPLALKGNPAVILLCGLQGSGKTTQCAKLAAHLKEKKKSVMLAACDLQRPAAIEQLKTLGKQIDVPVFSPDGEKKAVKVAKGALKEAKDAGAEVLIVDTAGRLHLDDVLMKELKEIRDVTKPCEVLFVASATTGQDAVKVASEFDERIGVTGSILTMLDGAARAGAAISIREVTGKPLKFEGVGEKVEDLQPFHPKSMADRILGMGDVINLVRKAEEKIDKSESEALEKKIRKASFTYADYLKQMGMIKRLGPLKSLFKMMPGLPDIGKMDMDEGQFKKLEAMILSMTAEERIGKDELLPSRRRRIAEGSGTTVDDVNRMVKGFKRLKQFMKDMPGFKKKIAKMGINL